LEGLAAIAASKGRLERGLWEVAEAIFEPIEHWRTNSVAA
jgi:hypothetical protein